MVLLEPICIASQPGLGTMLCTIRPSCWSVQPKTRPNRGRDQHQRDVERRAPLAVGLTPVQRSGSGIGETGEEAAHDAVADAGRRRPQHVGQPLGERFGQPGGRVGEHRVAEQTAGGELLGRRHERSAAFDVHVVGIQHRHEKTFRARGSGMHGSGPAFSAPRGKVKVFATPSR
uniref:hypothetical protein n=1 Tax=Streptomyces calvus TaxID=67282 RepID=UPI0035148FDF